MGSVSAKSLENGSDYKHDPLEGFPNGRKPRGNFLNVLSRCNVQSLSIWFYIVLLMCISEIKTTLAEMESAKIPLDKRDYCVDYLMKFLGCRNEKFQWVYKCHHEKHEYLHCQYEEYLYRYYISGCLVTLFFFLVVI